MGYRASIFLDQVRSFERIVSRPISPNYVVTCWAWNKLRTSPKKLSCVIMCNVTYTTIHGNKLSGLMSTGYVVLFTHAQFSNVNYSNMYGITSGTSCVQLSCYCCTCVRTKLILGLSRSLGGRGVLFHSFQCLVGSRNRKTMGAVYISLATHQEDKYLPVDGYRVYGQRANLTRASRTIVSGVWKMCDRRQTLEGTVVCGKCWNSL